jgi:hypothetical protein
MRNFRYQTALKHSNTNWPTIKEEMEDAMQKVEQCKVRNMKLQWHVSSFSLTPVTKVIWKVIKFYGRILYVELHCVSFMFLKLIIVL